MERTFFYLLHSKMIMNDLDFAPTQATPAIHAAAHSGVIEMRGDSYPENTFEFFTPLLSWIEERLQTDAPVRLQLHLLYLNTSSVKVMMDIFDLLEEAHSENQTVSTVWYYDEDNERIAELAEEFKEDCTFPFEIVRSDAASRT